MAYALKNDTVKEKIKELRTMDLYDDGRLNLDKLCEKLSIPVYNFDFEDKQRSGALLKEKDHWSIYVNSSDSPQRKRFTTAHEIGHYISYISGSLSKPLLDKEEMIVDSAVAAAFRDPVQNEVELEANEIAGQLLMPEADVRECFTQGLNPEQMAERFNVSESAMSVRLRNIKLYTMEDPQPAPEQACQLQTKG